jgi:hypothetical protein
VIHIVLFVSLLLGFVVSLDMIIYVQLQRNVLLVWLAPGDTAWWRLVVLLLCTVVPARETTPYLLHAIPWLLALDGTDARFRAQPSTEAHMRHLQHDNECDIWCTHALRKMISNIISFTQENTSNHA